MKSGNAEKMYTILNNALQLLLRLQPVVMDVSKISFMGEDKTLMRLGR